MPRVTASYEYDGLPDYWSGNGRRWDDDAGCVFATIGLDTTYADIIEEWMADYSDFDGKDAFEAITDDELRSALRSVFLDDLDLSTLHPIAAEWRAELGHDPGNDRCSCDACNDRVMDYCQAIALVELVEDDD